MANEISKIKIGNTTYNLYDTTLRKSIIGQQPKRLGLTSTDNGTGGPGQTVTLTSAASYLLFGVQGDNIGRAVMMLGTGHHPTTRDTETQYVSMLGGYDNGSASYLNKIYFQVTSGKQGKFIDGSRHTLASSGSPGTEISTIYAFGGLL